MKNIKNMSELEILALKDEQIDNLIKVEKMEQGVKLLETPIEPEYEETPKKDKIFYGVSTLDSFYFETEQEAIELKKVLTAKLENAFFKRYSKTPTNRKNLDRYDQKYYNPTITSESYYSPEMAEIGNSIENRNKILRDRYNTLKEEYDSYSEDVSCIVNDIWSKVREVRTKYTRLRELRDKLSEYQTLSESKKDALTFFLKAYPITDEELTLIQNGDLGDKKTNKK